MGQQWPDTCTEILVSAALGGPVYESYHRAQRQPKNWRRIIPKKSLHCCKIPGPPIAEKRREGKGKGKQERYPSEHTVPKNSKERSMQSDQCKEIEENNRMGKTRDLFKKIRDPKGTFHAKMGIT